MTAPASIVEAVAVDSVTLMIPLVWAASGEAVGEQAGVLNVGIEGVMLFSAFTTAFGFRMFGNLWIAWLLAVPVGGILGLLLWYLYVYRACNQLITGLMFDLLILGLTTSLFTRYLTGIVPVSTIGNFKIPGLGDIPGIGPVLFDQSPIFYIAVVIAALLYYMLWHSWLGLFMRAAGERPAVADGAGISVVRIRMVAVVVACTMAALGGASLTVINTGSFVVDMTAGEGFIALAIVILGRWNPLWIIVGSWVFGVSDALQFQLADVPALAGVPHDVWLAAPYIVTISIIAVARRSVYPSAMAVPWESVGRRHRLLPE